MELTRAQRDVLVIARMGRLYVYTEGGFWFDSNSGIVALPQDRATAALRLLADGGLEADEPEAGSAPVEITEAGMALLAAWTVRP